MDIACCNDKYQLIKMDGMNLKIVHMIFVADFLYAYSSCFGVTAGAHRYWTHKTYRAKLPLRIILAVLYLIIGMVKSSKGITFN